MVKERRYYLAFISSFKSYVKPMGCELRTTTQEVRRDKGVFKSKVDYARTSFRNHDEALG